MRYAAKMMEILKNRIDVTLLNNRKRLLKMCIKTKLYATLYVKIFENNLLPIRKTKVK